MKKLLALLISFLIVSSIAQAATTGGLTNATGITATSGGGSIGTLGTGVAAALATNVGTDGAFVVKGDALGTPSSGSAANLTSIPVANATGVGDVAHGFTGASTLTAHAVILGNGTSVVQTVGPCASGTVLTGNGGSADPTCNSIAETKIRNLGFSSSSAATGIQGAYALAPCAGSIIAWHIEANAGTATFQVWKVATGTAAPTVANSINTSGVSLSSNTAIYSTTLSDFTTTTVAANDIFAFNVSATSGATNLSGGIQIRCTN